MLVEPVLWRLLAKSDLLVLPSYTVSLHCDKLTDIGEHSHVKLKEGKSRAGKEAKIGTAEMGAHLRSCAGH